MTQSRNRRNERNVGLSSLEMKRKGGHSYLVSSSMNERPGLMAVCSVDCDRRYFINSVGMNSPGTPVYRRRYKTANGSPATLVSRYKSLKSAIITILCDVNLIGTIDPARIILTSKKRFARNHGLSALILLFSQWLL